MAVQPFNSGECKYIYVKTNLFIDSKKTKKDFCQIFRLVSYKRLFISLRLENKIHVYLLTQDPTQSPTMCVSRNYLFYLVLVQILRDVAHFTLFKAARSHCKSDEISKTMITRTWGRYTISRLSTVSFFILHTHTHKQNIWAMRKL